VFIVTCGLTACIPHQLQAQHSVTSREAFTFLYLLPPLVTTLCRYVDVIIYLFIYFHVEEDFIAQSAANDGDVDRTERMRVCEELWKKCSDKIQVHFVALHSSYLSDAELIISFVIS